MARRGGRKAQGGRRAQGGRKRKGGFWGTLASVGIPVLGNLINSVINRKRGSGLAKRLRKGGRKGGIWMGRDTRAMSAAKLNFGRKGKANFMKAVPM